MRIVTMITCLPLLWMLAACQPPGFYDSHGSYHSSDKGFQGQTARRTNAADDANAVSYSFSKPGFYDDKGNYVNNELAPKVPDDLLPPSGMCRLWSPDKALSMQQPADDCRDKYHLPSDTYVIYGGE